MLVEHNSISNRESDELDTVMALQSLSSDNGRQLKKAKSSPMILGEYNTNNPHFTNLLNGNNEAHFSALTQPPLINSFPQLLQNNHHHLHHSSESLPSMHSPSSSSSNSLPSSPSSFATSNILQSFPLQLKLEEKNKANERNGMYHQQMPSYIHNNNNNNGNTAPHATEILETPPHSSENGVPPIFHIGSSSSSSSSSNSNSNHHHHHHSSHINNHNKYPFQQPHPARITRSESQPTLATSSSSISQIHILEHPDDLCVVGEHRICQSRIAIKPAEVQDLQVYLVPLLKPDFIIPDVIRYKSMQYSSKQKCVVVKLSFPGMTEFSQILKEDFPSFDGRVLLLYKHPIYSKTYSKEFRLISKLPSNQSKKRSRKELSSSGELDKPE